MTLDEAIKYEEEIAEENQRVVDTGIIYDDVTVDMLYCDDTEVIEEHLANYQRCAEAHRQLAEWLKELKRLKEQEPKTDYKAFAEWVVSEIFDENWEDNKDSFVEIACRKLEKLGIVRVKGDEWELVESQESEVQNGRSN